MSEYTREEILRRIEENGGPEGLDLSNKDLSKIDLGAEAIAKELKKYRKQHPDKTPVWFSEDTDGVNLFWANLQEANLEGANLEKANIWEANLQKVVLGWANLQKADLKDANLKEAKLWRANLQEADLSAANLQEAFLLEANLKEASLWGANLEKTILWRANLKQAILGGANLQKVNLQGAHLERVDMYDVASLAEAYFYGAFLDQTRMRKEQLGSKIGEEVHKEYYLAKEAYLLLKNNFNQIGRYDDASWAYVKERQMEKMTHWPLSYALKCYGKGELPKEYGTWSRRVDLFWFYLRHLRLFVTDWITELLCLYGESPLRVVAWAAAFAFLFFPLLYSLFGGVVTTDGSPVTWGEYLRLSLGSFATIELPNIQAQGIVAQFLRTLEALTGISLLALLMFTLGNRISRS